MQEEGRLADPGLTGEERHRGGHEASTQNPVDPLEARGHASLVGRRLRPDE